MTAETLPVPGHRHGLVDGLDFEEYLAWPALSASSARKLLPPSCPALFRQQQLEPETSDRLDLGKVAHAVVLEGFDVSAVVVEVQADDWRTKAAREQKAAAQAEGKIAMLPAQVQVVRDMAAALRRNPMARSLFDLDSGKAEQSMFWVEPKSGAPRKGRLDFLPERRSSGRLVLADYKSAASAEATEWARSAVNFGYHQQQAGYEEGIVTLGLDDEPQILFVVQEVRPPYLVNVLQIEDEALRIARELNRWACRVYAECTESGRWPGYSDQVEIVRFPGWYLRQYEELAK